MLPYMVKGTFQYRSLDGKIVTDQRWPKVMVSVLIIGRQKGVNGGEREGENDIATPTGFEDGERDHDPRDVGGF